MQLRTNVPLFALAFEESCTILATFAPTAIGPISTTLEIRSNADNLSIYDVALEGTGIPYALYLPMIMKNL
jgi:hypothetical protein